MSAWIVYSKDGSVERCELKSLEYGGTAMGERAVTATFRHHSEVAFEVFDYIEYRGEKFELEAVPTVKKVSSFEYIYELRFVSLKYELERCEMRDLVPYDNELVYPTPLTFSFTGDVRYLTERIQACLDNLYGEGAWNIIIADGVGSEEKNITIAQQNCWNALALVSSTYGLSFYIKGRTITIGGEQPLVNHTFEYGKGNGLYEIERASDTDTGIITKLRAYGSTRNLDYSYPKRPEWSDSALPVSFAFSPLRLMLPSFKTDGKTDYVLADSAIIAKYGIREASMVYDDIYPSITGATYNGQAIDEIKAVEPVDDNSKTFVVYLHDLGFDLEEHLTNADAQISMKTGAMQGYTFTMSVIEKQDDSSYKIILGRISAEGGDNYNIPNSDWNMKAGDKFVLLNILMPQAYIREAENRLKQRAEEYLAQYSKTNFSYNIGLHDKFLIENPSVYDSLVEGSRLRVRDGEIGIDEEVTIQSITITESAEDNILPQVKVTLNNEPSASTLERIQGKIDALANETAAGNFATQSEIMAQYRKKLDKPYFDKLFVAVDAEGNEIASNDITTPIAYIKAKYDFAVVGGVAMYATDKDLDLPSIYDGLPLDNDTIYWEEIKDEEGNVIDKRIKARGGSGEGMVGLITLADGDVLSEKMTLGNTIYEVTGNFDLKGETIKVPSNSAFFFNGGKFTNGTIQGNNTEIVAARNYNFFDNCTLRGFNTGFFDVRWFGGVPDYDTASNSGTDNAIFFDRAIKACGLNTGAYVRVIGKYLIGSTITVKHDLVMQGDYHPNRTFRAESGVEEEGCNSLIFVKSGVTAFLVVGRGDSGMRSSQLFINNIKFVGGAIGSSVLIEYTATGAPTRVGKFAGCVCTNFRRVLYFHDKDGGSEGTIYGNLTIEKVFAYYNNQFLVATVSAATVASRPSFMSLCNLMIKDSTIEQNGSNAIYLERLFGPTVINNCLLEATPNAIYATVIAGSLEITNNYFEQQGGSYMIHVEGMNVNNCFFTYTGNYRVNADKGKKFEISGFTVVDFNTSGYQRSDVKFEGCIVEKNLWRKVNVSGIGSHSRFTDIKYYKVYPYDDFAFPMSFGAKKLKGGMLGLIGHKGTKSRVARTWCPVVSGDNLLLCYYFDGASQHEVYLCNDSGAVIANEKPVLYGGAEGIQFFKFKINSATSYINVYMDCSNPICIGNGFIFKNVPDDMCLDELGIMYPNDLSGDSNVAYKNAEGLRGMTYVSEGVYDGLYYSDGNNIRNGDGSIFTKVKVITKYVDGWTFTDANTVYRIAGDLALGKEVTMPSGCTLDFSLGGKISTGKLRLTSTKILPYGLNTSNYATNGFTGSYAEGQVIYNSASKRMELYNGSSWVKLDGSSL